MLPQNTVYFVALPIALLPCSLNRVKRVKSSHRATVMHHAPATASRGCLRTKHLSPSSLVLSHKSLSRSNQARGFPKIFKALQASRTRRRSTFRTPSIRPIKHSAAACPWSCASGASCARSWCVCGSGSRACACGSAATVGSCSCTAGARSGSASPRPRAPGAT